MKPLSDSGQSAGAGTPKFADPVCGMTVGSDTALSMQHDGHQYHFCSEHCRTEFKKTPARYLERSHATHRHKTSNKSWTCPMHPEVVRDGPGACPICGMALEPSGVPAEGSEEDNPELRDMTRRFWFALGLTVPLMAIVMSDMLPGRPASRLLPAGWRGWIELALATPVCLWSAWPFYVRAIQSVRTLKLNMFTLIGLGVSVAYGYSLASVVPYPPSESVTASRYLSGKASTARRTISSRNPACL